MIDKSEVKRREEKRRGEERREEIRGLIGLESSWYEEWDSMVKSILK